MNNRFNYSGKEWESARRFVLRRDNYTCKFCGQLCLGKRKNGHSPIVDHIEPVKERPDLALDVTNMRVLCRSCDNKRHSEKGKESDVPQVCEDGYPEDSEWR